MTDLALAVCLTLCFAVALCLALAAAGFAGVAEGADMGAAFCAATGVEITAKGNASTVALKRMDSNFFMRNSVMVEKFRVLAACANQAFD